MQIQSLAKLHCQSCGDIVGVPEFFPCSTKTKGFVFKAFVPEKRCFTDIMQMLDFLSNTID
jgi:hypothetical protein